MSQKQAKRRRREQRPGTQQEGPKQFSRAEEEVRDLEELLKSGDIDRYAEACWSLANKSSHPPPKSATKSPSQGPAKSMDRTNTNSGSPPGQ